MPVDIQSMPGLPHGGMNDLFSQHLHPHHAQHQDDLPQEIQNLLQGIASPEQGGMTDQQKMEWAAIARMIGNQFMKDIAAKVGGNSSFSNPSYSAFDPMQQGSESLDSDDDLSNSNDQSLDDSMPPLQEADASDDSDLPDGDDSDDDTPELTQPEAIAQPAAQPAAATPSPAAAPAPAPASVEKSASPTATTAPQSVDGGGPNSITVQNTTDKPMTVAFFKNLAPGEHPNFDGAEKTFTIPPHSSTEVSMPADWQGRLQKFNGSTQDKSNWAEINFEQKTGKIWFDESDIPGRNASITMTSDDGQVAGSSKSVLKNAPSSLLRTDQAGEQTINSPQDFTGKTDQSAVDFLDQQIGTRNAYVLPDDNNAVRVSNSKHLTVALGDA